MTDLPVQTFLIGCREDSLASHGHTPKNVYKRRDNDWFEKEKMYTPRVIKLCYTIALTQRHKPDMKTSTAPKMSTLNTI